MGEIFKPTLVLLAICIVISAGVATVYNVTEDTISALQAEAAESRMNEVLPNSDSFTNIKEEAIATNANTNEDVLLKDAFTSDKGYVFILSFSGYGGAVEVFVGMDYDGMIKNMKIGENSETPSVGKKAEEEPFTSLFEDINVDEKIDSKVDTISGATITSSGVIEAVQVACDYYSALNE